MHRYISVMTAARVWMSAAVFAAVVSPPPAVVTTSQTAPMDEGRWVGMVQRLGNDDFSQREAAQKELEGLGWRDLSLLRRFAERTRDPEIKARLFSRVAAIEEEIAITPPPVSVDFKNASLGDVAAEFSRLLGKKTDILPLNPAAEADGTFAFWAIDKPFWEVMTGLSRQRPFTIQDLGTRLRLIPQNPGWNSAYIYGPMIVVPLQITRVRMIVLQDMQENPLMSDASSLQVTFGFDPRMRLLGYSGPQFSEMRDELGNDLMVRGNERPEAMPFVASRNNILTRGISLKAFDKRGSRIMMARGEMRVQVQVGEDRLEIENAETKVGQSFQFAGFDITLVRFELKNGQGINLALQMVRDTKMAADVRAKVIAMQRQFEVSVIDGAGRNIYSAITPGTMSTTVSGAFQIPLRLRFAVPGKTKEVVFPFVLKDIPLP